MYKKNVMFINRLSLKLRTFILDITLEIMDKTKKLVFNF